MRALKARSTPQTKRVLVGFTIICPTTGVIAGGKRIVPHKVQTILCANGSIMGWCAVHYCRIFISERKLCNAITGMYPCAVEMKVKPGPPK